MEVVMAKQATIGQEVMFMPRSSSEYVSGLVIEVILTDGRGPFYRLDNGDVLPPWRVFPVKERITAESGA
jgi:hypothetical protein